MHLTDEQIKKLESTACQLRQDVISMLLEAKSGHSAGPLGMADVFTVLYFTCAVNHDPKNPDWPERDRIVLIKRPYLSYSICGHGPSRLFSG